jgi:hypothetical protein
MNPRQQVQLLLGVGLLLSASGCASIVSGQSATVKIDSYPSNAHVVIQDKHGAEVATVMTPATVSLRRGDRMFLPAKYTATVMAPGYESAQIPIHSTINPWCYGNIVLGGIPGLVVDGATGALWKPTEDTYTQHLKPLPVTEQPEPYSVGQASAPAMLWPAPAAPQTSAYPVVPTAYSPAVQPAPAVGQAAPVSVNYTTLAPAVETTPWPLSQTVQPQNF